MAELPEIYQLAKQMNEVLYGKICHKLTVKQEKCLNMTLPEMKNRIIGATVQSVRNIGKWLVIRLSNDENILISLGMGGDLLYFDLSKSAKKEFQIKLEFEDESGFTIRFWWFGKFYVCRDSEMLMVKTMQDIAVHPFDRSFNYTHFRRLFQGRRGKVKAFLLNQKNISGIGNVYIHDILFESHIHPNKQIGDMTEGDFESLYEQIVKNLRYSYEKGGLAYEMDFFGNNGNYTTDEFKIAYKKEGKCPVCNGEIEIIKTGSNRSYVCPNCQKR